MSIASEISRIESAKNALKAKINAKNDSSHQITNETIDEFGDFVDDIPTGSSDIVIVPTNSGTSTPIIVDYIKEVDTTNWDMSNITSAYTLFYSCKGLTSINLAGFGTNNINSAASMFASCSNLTSIDLKPFNMSKVTSLESMFTSCTNLTSADFTNCNLSIATTIRYLFRYCSALQTVDFTNVTIPAVTNAQNAFTQCNSLSNNSLNEIMRLIGTSNISSSNKTLKYIGLTSAQATTCTGLSNWATLQAAGWTTGY